MVSEFLQNSNQKYKSITTHVLTKYLSKGFEVNKQAYQQTNEEETNIKQSDPLDLDDYNITIERTNFYNSKSNAQEFLMNHSKISMPSDIGLNTSKTSDGTIIL